MKRIDLVLELISLSLAGRSHVDEYTKMLRDTMVRNGITDEQELTTLLQNDGMRTAVMRAQRILENEIFMSDSLTTDELLTVKTFLTSDVGKRWIKLRYDAMETARKQITEFNTTIGTRVNELHYVQMHGVAACAIYGANRALTPDQVVQAATAACLAIVQPPLSTNTKLHAEVEQTTKEVLIEAIARRAEDKPAEASKPEVKVQPVPAAPEVTQPATETTTAQKEQSPPPDLLNFLRGLLTGLAGPKATPTEQPNNTTGQLPAGPTEDQIHTWPKPDATTAK